MNQQEQDAKARRKSQGEQGGVVRHGGEEAVKALKALAAGVPGLKVQAVERDQRDGRGSGEIRCTVERGGQAETVVTYACNGCGNLPDGVRDLHSIPRSAVHVDPIIPGGKGARYVFGNVQ